MARYLRYVIKNIEPIRIADESTSQRGQTNTLRYIPGTTIRGLVISTLAKENDFEEQWKEKLFSKDTAYLNAMLMVDEKELITSPKGFYEDKSVTEGEKEIQNVVIDGAFEEGYKRAGLGRYCRLDGECIRYYNVDTGSDLKIKINTAAEEKRNVFRNEYIMPGQLFCGYIKIGFQELEEKLKAIFQGTIVLGNARSAGLGKCNVVSCEIVDRIPYAEYLPKEQNGYCYMMLLSNTAMRNQNGEICGIDCEKLQERMGVKNLQIEFCASSTMKVQGYNRTWQARVPSVVMFEQGSVFKLRYEGTLTEEKIRALCDEGIGIRRNEGCGRVLFLADYEAINKKCAGEPATVYGEVTECHDEDKEILHQTAKRLYESWLNEAAQKAMVNGDLLRKGSISRSQLGILDSLISACRYNPTEARKLLEQYLDKQEKKEENRKVQKDFTSGKQIKDFVQKVFDKKPEELVKKYMPEDNGQIMGINISELFSEEEELGWKLQFLTALIRYDNKKESR